MNSLSNLAAFRVVPNSLLIRMEEMQNKTHRRRRINKKWRKRYGVTRVLVPYTVVIGDTAYMHPSIIEQLKNEFAEGK